MTGPEVLRIGVRTAGALESVHRGGVVHGDLRASSVLLSDSGDPLVVDAALVTLTGANIAATGDPRDLEHASPEQLDGQYLTPASDQYSLATILYHLLAGEAAFVRPGETSVVPVIKRIATDAPADLTAKGVPAAAAEVVNKALSKNPADRYSNMQAFARALQQAEVALGLPVTDLTVMTPATTLPTVWSSAPVTPASPVAPSTMAPIGAPSGAPSGGPPPSSGSPPSSGPPSGPPTGAPPSGGPPSGPPAAAGAPAKSRKPLFVGIGVVVVVVLVAAFLLTRGGNDKKDASSSSSVTTTTRRGSNSSKSTASSTDSASDGAPAGFITDNESFQHGTVEVFVPSDWTDSFPVQLDNGEPRLRVAPDANAFVDGTFTHPGVQIDAFGVEANGLNNADNLDALLDNFLSQPPESDGVPGGPAATSCTPSAHANYPADLGTTSDGGFTGRFERLTACKGAGSIVVIFAVPADKSFILQVVVQVVTPEDEAALPTIVGSILVADFP